MRMDSFRLKSVHSFCEKRLFHLQMSLIICPTSTNKKKKKRDALMFEEIFLSP